MKKMIKILILVIMLIGVITNQSSAIAWLMEIDEENIIEEIKEQTQQGKTDMSSTNLKVLRMNQVGMTPTFDPEVREYYFVTDAITELEVIAIPENEKSQVVIEGNKNMQMGNHVITITITSEDESQQSEYQIHVTRTNNMVLANTNLETLAILQGTLAPEFDNLITEYEVEVDNDVKNIDILAIPQSMNASVLIEKNETLTVGNNLIVVTVLAEDQLTEKQYRITVHRRSSEEQRQSEQERKNNIQRATAILKGENNYLRNVIEENNTKNIIIAFSILLGIITILTVIWWKHHKRKSTKNINH